MKPRRVIRFADGNVLSLNICGEKIEELSGLYEDVRDLVNARSDAKTHFEVINGEGEREETVIDSW
jgi:hypothetical protein